MTLEAKYVITGIIFVLGVFVGRFLNRCIIRIPETVGLTKELKQIFLKSPRQGYYPPTRWYHRLPVVGTMCLLGRSPYSGRRVLKREPFIELLNGVLLAWLFWLEVPVGLDPKTSSLSWILGPEWITGVFKPDGAFLVLRYLYHVVLVEALVVGTFIDFDHYLLPDATTLPAMLVGIVGATIAGCFWFVPIWFQNSQLLDLLVLFFPEELVQSLKGPPYPPWITLHPHLHGFLNSLVGLIVGSGMIWVIRFIGFVTLKKEAMGFGDVILMAMVGTFMGWQNCVVIFFLAPLFALVSVILTAAFFRRAIPYGPYLSLATLAVLYGWPMMQESVFHFFAHGLLIPILGLIMAALMFALLYMMQLLKRLAGIDDTWEFDAQAAWTSGDHLAHYAGENNDLQQGQWKKAQHPLTTAGRGQQFQQTWRGR